MCKAKPTEKKRRTFAKRNTKVNELNDSYSENADIAGLSYIELHPLKRQTKFAQVFQYGTGALKHVKQGLLLRVVCSQNFIRHALYHIQYAKK